MAEANAEVKDFDEKSASKSTSGRDCDALVEELADDYVKYLDLNISDEKATLDESIEEMLTRLDEFCGLVDLIRSDTSLCINETIPNIQEKSLQLQTIFHKIDKLEEFVNMVKANLALVEEQVNKAEDEMGTFSSIRKMISGIQLPSFMRKNPSQLRRPEPKPKYEPPPIFSADDYFGPQPQKKRSRSQTERARSSSTDGRTNRSKSESVVPRTPGASGSDSGIEVAADDSGDL